MLEPSFVLMKVVEAITDGIFETGALGVLRKSQNPTVLGQDSSSSTQCLTLAEHVIDANDMPSLHVKIGY